MLSDSHDNFPELLRAVEALCKRNVELIAHAGDVIAPGMAYAFAGCGVEVKLVFGNNDGDRKELERNFAKVGGECLGDFGEIRAGGLRIALLHGIHEPIVRALVDSGDYDVVIRGHDHHVRVERGKTLLINPGEVWGFFTGQRSAAVLDTDTLEVEIIDLGRAKSIREMIAP